MRLKLIVCCFCMCKGKENVREVIGPFWSISHID